MINAFHATPWRAEGSQIFDANGLLLVDIAGDALIVAGIVQRISALNTPETKDFLRGVEIEAPHQRYRWGVDHDEGKSSFDWFWLIGYLAQKAAEAALRGDGEKASHHIITTAAALLNWHLRLTGVDLSMRPGIAKPEGVGHG